MNHRTLKSFAAVALLTGCHATAAIAAGAPRGSSMITLDCAKYLAPIDLHFTKPTQPIEGIPLGNGKMGSLVWIDGSGSKLHSIGITRKAKL